MVIGGSPAGLMAARVLADHFERVTVLERDHIEDRPALRRSVPQGSHAHALMHGGQLVMERLYPGFGDKLVALGAVRARAGREFAVLSPVGKAYSFGGAVKEPHDLGIDIYYQSRSLLEHCVRRCTLESTNISLQSDLVVKGLLYSNGRVRGAVYDYEGDSHSSPADLVVEAGGRGSHAPQWLRDLGFAAPEETRIGVDFAYSTAKYRLVDYTEPERGLSALGPGPNYPKAGFFVVNEGDAWLLTLGGRFGDYPPTDEEGFLAFAKSLHTPKLYDLVRNAERVSEITHHRFPSSLRRHYERLADFPEGFLVIGDAVASFNPLYAQGMSSAALQAEALRTILNETVRLEGIAARFFPKVAEVVSTPWMLSANSDFAFPQTRGERPPGLNDNDRYVAAVEALSAEDLEVQILVWEVFNLAKPLSALSEEPLRSRVLERMKNNI